MRTGRLWRGAAAAPDLLVIAGWWALICTIGFWRKDFCGDGVRHLPAILESAYPHLGEPRWLFLPALLFIVLRPAVALGLVHDVEGLTRLMMAATVVAAGVYLLAVRACLAARGIAPGRRAVALAVAGGSAGLLVSATDLMEPIFGAMLVAVGLAVAARRASAPGASADDCGRALLSATAAIAAATLLYQGLLLGLGLVPLVVPGRTLRDRRALAQAALILAAVPLVMVGALSASGNSIGRAVARSVLAEENPLYRSYLGKPGFTPYLVALAAGPPLGVVTLGQHRGFRGVLADLHTTATRWPALLLLARLGFAMAVLAAGVIAAWRRRDWPLLWSLFALLVLPVMFRPQLHGYIKFYVLLPIVLAFGAARASPAAAAAVAALLLALNAGPLLASLPAQQRFYGDRVEAYARADAHSCWLTTGWVPTFSFRWPGAVCPILGSLAKGSGEDVERVTAAGRAALTACLEDCFCRSSAVFTDDMTESARPLVADSARHFGYTAVDLQAVVLPVQRARLASRAGSTLPVYQYPPDEQRRRCELMPRHR
ncbi:MAG TPA: hypothetical protein VHQ90_22015 [Thermoanaerobaculia bacterium]|nr:hypothetical protein [Thermoanaerobaculia bacterium]